MNAGCGRPGHFGMVDVDDYNVAYWSCMYPGGRTMCGEGHIYGKVTPAKADAIRRASSAEDAALLAVGVRR